MSLPPRQTSVVLPKIPGPVLDGDSGYAWPTWREALDDAHKGVAWAYERRRRTMQAAFDAGLSMRQIAECVGMSAAGVQKIIGKQRHRPDDALDAPAFQPQEASMPDAQARQSEVPLTEQQRAILEVLKNSPTPRRASWFVRHTEPRRPVKSHAGVLRGLRERGLVVKHFDPGWNGDRWEITDAGREALR